MYEDRVRRGAALLDRLRPGWAGAIDQGFLDQGSCYTCVLGQLFGDFLEGLKETGTDLGGREVDHGFDCDPDEVPGHVRAQYEALDAAWRAEIRARLGTAGRGGGQAGTA